MATTTSNDNGETFSPIKPSTTMATAKSDNHDGKTPPNTPSKSNNIAPVPTAAAAILGKDDATKEKSNDDDGKVSPPNAAPLLVDTTTSPIVPVVDVGPASDNNDGKPTLTADVSPIVVGDSKKIAAGIVSMAKKNGVALGVLPSKTAVVATTPSNKNKAAQSNAAVVTVAKKGGRGNRTTRQEEAFTPNATTANDGFRHSSSSPFQQQALSLHLNYLMQNIEFLRQGYASRVAAAERARLLHHELHGTAVGHENQLKYWEQTPNNSAMALQQIKANYDHWKNTNQFSAQNYEALNQDVVAALQAWQLAEGYLKAFMEQYATNDHSKREGPTMAQQPAAKKPRKTAAKDDAKLASTNTSV